MSWSWDIKRLTSSLSYGADFGSCPLSNILARGMFLRAALKSWLRVSLLSAWGAWGLARHLCLCLYLWKTSQWAFIGIWRLGKWRYELFTHYSHFSGEVCIASSRVRTSLGQGFWPPSCNKALQDARAFWSSFYWAKSRMKQWGILFYLLTYLGERAEVRKYNIKKQS